MSGGRIFGCRGWIAAACFAGALGLGAAPEAALGAGSPTAPGERSTPADAPAVREVNSNLPTTTLTVRGQRMIVEIAATPMQREIGLMNRFSLQPDHGMLFVFESAQPLAFWMKNTYIPLSVAFVDANGRILNIEAMAPQDLATHWSRGPALYAIEMRQGWFLDHGIGPGDVLEGLTAHAAPH